jgi:phosphonate transport system permease protein
VLGLGGAGGLGFELAQSFSALRYDEIWTLLAALLALCGVTDVWSAAVRRRQARGRRRDPALIGSLVLVAALVPVSALALAPDVSVLWAPRTWELTGQLLDTAWPPALGVPAVEFLTLAGATVAMSVLAIAIACTGGALLAFPAADLGRLLGGSRAGRWLVVGPTRVLLVVLRAVPPPVWALLCLFVLAPGILAGAAALGIYTLGVLGRLMAESVENLDERPSRALRAAGASASVAFAYGVLPAATPRFIAYGLYRWEVTIRETVVVGIVGAGGLGLLLNTQLATFDYEGALSTLAAFITLTLIVDLASATVHRSLQ